MNWLAHVLLSEDENDFRIGGLLADHLRHQPLGGISDTFELGFKRHLEVDAFTDSHPAFLRSKSRLGRGVLRGAAIDLAYDHFLSVHWEKFSELALEEFLGAFYAELGKELKRFPEDCYTFLKSVIDRNRLGLYVQKSGVLLAMQAVDQKLAKRVDKRFPKRLKPGQKVENYYPLFLSCYNELESDFLGFFPEAIEKFLKCKCSCALVRG